MNMFRSFHSSPLCSRTLPHILNNDVASIVVFVAPALSSFHFWRAAAQDKLMRQNHPLSPSCQCENFRTFIAFLGHSNVQCSGLSYFRKERSLFPVVYWSEWVCSAHCTRFEFGIPRWERGMNPSPLLYLISLLQVTLYAEN